MNDTQYNPNPIKVLALEPYFGGSHKSFLTGLRDHSRHDWELLTLPPFKWKWRMRHAPLTYRNQLYHEPLLSQKFDLIFCSDMLNLAEFIGLTRSDLQQLPTVIYFHENQLTYPFRDDFERDRHFAFSNFSSALRADEVWFNSSYHQNNFLIEMERFLKKMPDFNLDSEIKTVRSKSKVLYPGINSLQNHSQKVNPVPRILWAARWEHDKNPELFFDAMTALLQQGIEFRLSVLGESFSDIPPVFAAAQEKFADHIDHFGYLKSRFEYESVLQNSDIFVSTADHEFFGLSVVEAIDAGCWPILPNRLSYPELIDDGREPNDSPFFYDGSCKQLVKKLSYSCQAVVRGERPDELSRVIDGMKQFHWPDLIQKYDSVISNLVSN